MNARITGRKAVGDKSAKSSLQEGASAEASISSAKSTAKHALGIADTLTVAQGAMRALEPRVLLDAAMEATFDVVTEGANGILSDIDRLEAQQQAEDNQALMAALSVEQEDEVIEIAFVDAGIENAEELIAGFDDHVEVIIIDSDSDGVEQMAAALNGRTDIDAIHIFSHGRSGTLDLGSTKLTEASMNARHLDEMAIIAASLSDDADILIYGCDFGANARGLSAVQALADLTGADVAASQDLTGAENLGGDWDLEVTAGTVETAAFEVASFDGTLAVTVINGSGGNAADGSDGLAIHVIENGQLQVEFKGATQLYHPSLTDDDAVLFNGVYLAVGNTVAGGGTDSNFGGAYSGPANGPGISSTDVVFVEAGQSVTGTGTNADPFIVTTTMFYDAGGAVGVYDPATDFQVEITTTYIVPNPYFTQSVTITPPATNTEAVKFYHAIDTFLNINVPAGDNPDEGPAFTLEQSPGNLSVVGVARDADGDGSIDSFTAFAEAQGGEEFDQYYSAQYDGAGLYTGGINDGGDIVNTIDTNPTTDNGLGIQFNLDDPSAAQTFEYHIAFRGEATIDLDGDDSSGAVGSGFNTSYEIGSVGSVPIVDADVSIQNVVGDIDEVRISLTNAQAGDMLTVNVAALPANVGIQSQTATEIILEATGGFALPEATFDLALQALGFTTTSTDETSRSIDFAVTNEIGEEGLASAGTITIVPIPEAPPQPQDDTFGPINENGTINGDLFADNGNGLDSDPNPGDIFTVTTIDGNAVTDGEEITLQSGASLTINADGTFSYNPGTAFDNLGNGETAQDSFTYQIADQGGLESAAATVTIDIDGENDAPIPQDPANPGTEADAMPAQTGDDSAPLPTFDVTDYFSDPDDTVLTYSLGANTPAWLSIDENTGEITGTPPADASQNTNVITNADGEYTITVIAEDPDGLTAHTTVTYTITNPAPDAIDDTFGIVENGNPLFENVFSNNPLVLDSDPDGDTFTLTEVNGVAGNVGNAIAGTNGGLFTISSNGALIFVDNGNFEDLAAGEARDTTITYTIDDGNGGTDTATVTVTVIGTDDNPILTGTDIPDQTGNDADTGISIDVTGAFTDPDTTDTLTYTATGLPDGLSLDLNTGEITGTIDPSASQNGNTGTPTDGVYTINVIASDGSGPTATETFVFTVSNPAPTATDDAITANEDTAPADFNVISDDNGGAGVDSDPDGDTPLTVTEVNGDNANVGQPIAGSNGGTFTINADGTTSFDPGQDFQYLDDTESATTTITYQVSDGEGGFDDATVTVTVNGINDAPIPVDPNDPNGPADPNDYVPAQSGTDNAPLTPFDTSIYFDDPDTSDTLEFSSPDMPAWMTIDPTTGLITGTPPGSASVGGPNNDGVYTFTIEVTDGDETITTQLTYDIGNLPPDAMADVYSTDGDSALTIAVGAGLIDSNDSDGDGDILSVTQINGQPLISGAQVTLPSGALLTLNDDGSFDYDPNGSFENLAAGEAGTDSFTYQVGDGDGLFDTAEVTINIAGVNDAPDAIDDAFTHTESAAPTTGNVLAPNTTDPDSDVDASDVLTVTEVNGNMAGVGSPVAGNAGGLFTIGPDGELVFDDNGDFEDLAAGEVRDTTITYTIDDGNGGTDTATVTVTVTGTNDAPVPVDPSDPNGPTDPNNYLPVQNEIDGAPITAPLDLTPFFTDADTSDTLTLSVDPAELPPGLTFNGTEIVGTPDANASQLTNTLGSAPGTYVIPITVDDGNGDTFTTNLTMVIANTVPVAEDDMATTDEDTPITNGNVINDDGLGSVPDIDADGDALIVSQVAGDAVNVGQPIAGSNGGTFTINADGTYSFDPGTDFNNLAVGEQTSTAIEYQISDNEGGTDTALITLVIDGVNDAPQINDPANPVPEQNLSDGQDFSTTPLLDMDDFVTDSDAVDTLTYTTTDPLPDGLMLNPDGTITGIVDNSASTVDNGDGPGVYVITVTADDGNGGTIDVPLIIDVSNLPPVAVNDASTGTEDAPQTGNLITDPLTGDSDASPDSDDVIVTQIEGQPVIAGTPTIIELTNGTLEVSEDGTWVFAPNGTANTLDDGETATETVTYVISDEQGGTSEATLTIDITGINDPVQVVDPTDPETDPENPVYDPETPTPIVDPDNLIDDITAVDGEMPPSIPAGDYFGDAEGDTLTFSTDGLPDGLSIDPSTGEITGTIDSDASQGGNTNTPGEYLVTITATDPQGNIATTTLNYTITNLPVIAENDDIIAGEDAPVTGSVFDDNGNGADSDTAPDSDVFIVSQVGGAAANVGQPTTGSNGGEFTINSDGTFTFEPGNDFQGLGVGETAITTITYEIDDGNGSTDTATVTFTVEGANDAPIPVDPTQPVVVDPSDPNAPPTDPDNPVEPPLDPQNYIPVQNGTDGALQTGLDLSPYFGDPDANDDVLITLDPNDLPEGLTFDPATGVISGTPSPDASQGGDSNNPGTYTIPVTATDPSGAEFATNITYVIENLPPMAQDDDLVAGEDAPIVANVLDDNGNGIDADATPDGDDIYVSAVDGQPANIGTPVTGSNGGEFTINADGTVIFDPAGQFEDLSPGETEETTITYTITDAQGGTDTATITVTVEGATDAPLASNPALDQTNADGETIDPLDISDQFDDPNGDPLTYTATGLPEGLEIDPVTGLITGVLPNDASLSGPYPVILTATNPQGGSVSTQLLWNVENPAPDAGDDNATTAPETPVTINPLGNDIDPDGDDLDVIAVTQPANGTVTINPDGTLEYTPNAGFSGPDMFTYTIDDGQGGTDTATVMVEVTDMPPAGSPTVDPISPVTGVDGEEIIPIDVSTNFDDPDVGPLTFTAVDLPPGLEINPETGVISGTIDPSASQVGPYDVTVTAVDPDGNQVSTTFPFDVTNPAPVAGNDQTATTPDTPVIINVLTNDSDPDGDTLTVDEVIQPANGTVTINPDGTLEYTPDAGFTGPDTFTYIVTDNEGGFSTATVTIEVSDAPSSEIPTATEIPNVDVIDGEAVPPGTSVVEFFDDPNGDPLIYTATGLPDGVELDPNTGELTGSVPSDASVDGPYDVTVTATDPDGNTITETFTIVSTNPAPVVENDATETTPETPVVINVLANDGDPDGDDAIIASTTPPTHGEVSINPDGTLTYTPDDGFIGEDTFTYTIDDGQGGTEVATVIVNVTSSPEGPIANPALPEQSATDGEDVSPLDASQAFSDVESDTLTFTANDLPEGLSIDPNTGLITGVVDPDASQLGTDPINAPGVYLVEVIATDPSGNEATVIVAYSIENQPPVAVDDNASAIEDIVQTGNVLTDPLTADADGDPDSDPLIVTEIAGQPIVAGSPTMIELTNGTLEMSDDGAWSFTPNGNANVLGDGETLIETVTYMIDDGQGGTDEAELTITIEGANDPVVLVDPNDPQTDPTDPTYDPANPQTPSDPESLVGTLTGTDDLPFAPIDLSPFFGDAEGDPITFTAIGLPEGLQIDPQTGIISGTPANDASADGPYNVTIIGTDPQGNTAELPVTIEIENQSPVLDIEVPDYTVYPGAPLQIPVSDYFSDPDLDTLTYTATGLPAGFTLDPSTGLISGDADPETVTGGPNSDGVFEVTVTIDDGQGGIVTDTFLIEVLPQAYVASPNVEAPIVREFPLDVQQSSSDQLPISNLVNSLSNLGPQIGLDADIHPVDAVISQLGDPAVGVALDGPHYIDELARYLDELIARDSADAAGFGAHGDDSHPYLRGESSAVVIPGQDSVLLQSMIWRGEVYIEMLDSYDGEVFGDIRGYRVTGPNGSDLPIWINQRADNFLQIDRPANVEVVAIEVHTTLSDGSVRTIDLIIDLVTGEMQSSVENDVVASENSTFNQRLATLAEEPQRKQSALLSALKTHSV